MSSSEGCGGSLCRCLASVPCSVLCMFLALVSAIIACGGALIVAFHRTRDVLGLTDMWPYFMYVCLGIGIAMLVLAVVFLVVGSLSAKHTAETLFTGGRRLRCIRGFNVLVIVLMALMQFAWLLISIGLSTTVLYLLLINNLDSRGAKCVNLAHYAVPKKPKQLMCNDDMSTFLDDIKKEELLICYAVSFVSSVVIVVCLTLFMINGASNYAHLGKQSKKNASRGAGGNDIPTSSHMPIGSYHSYDGRPLATETAM